MGLRSLLNNRNQNQVLTTVKQPTQQPFSPGSNFQQTKPYVPPSAATTQGPVGFNYSNVHDRTLGPGVIHSDMGFINAARGLSREELQKGISSESDLSQALRGASGQGILDMLGGLQGNAAIRRNLTNASLDRALNRNLASARRQFAGTGLAGTSQGGRSVGELLGRAQQANIDSELAQQDQYMRDLLGLTQGSGAVQGQELESRKMKFLQQQALSDLLNSQANAEIQRQGGLASAQPGGPSLLESLGLSLGSQALGAGIGAFTGGIGGGLASKALGGAVGSGVAGGAAGGARAPGTLSIADLLY